MVSQFKKPSVCQMGVLTAALQEPFGRDPFAADPLVAAVQALTDYWIPLAGRHGLHLEAGGAFFFQDGYIPPEKMLDPVASHIPVRTPKKGEGIDLSAKFKDQILESCAKHGTKIRTIGVFENLLHDDPLIRSQIHEHVRRQGRAAKLLGADGVTLFIGRNVKLGLDANFKEFITVVIPLFKYLIEELGLTVFLENCPMPGWNNQGLWVNNLCNAPYTWVAIHEICRRFGIANGVVINYDASHTILQKSTPRKTFKYLQAAGIPQMLGRVHCKDQHHDEDLVAAGDGRGQACLRGDYEGGELAAEAEHWKAWLEMDCHHGLPGLKHYNAPAQLAGREVDWMEHQYELRNTIGIDPQKFVLTLEHEWNAMRLGLKSDPDARDKIEAIIATSAGFLGATDLAAAYMFSGQSLVDSYGRTLPNEPDDRLFFLDRKMRAHADGIRAQVEKLFAAA